jgi:hypothetical protein
MVLGKMDRKRRGSAPSLELLGKGQGTLSREQRIPGDPSLTATLISELVPLPICWDAGPLCLPLLMLREPNRLMEVYLLCNVGSHSYKFVFT